jgi:hypothetical protein
MLLCRAVAAELRPLSHVINRQMPQSVKLIAAGVNTAYMAAMVDALGWLDTSIVCSFVQGFMVVGDIPDSGVYRPIPIVADAVFLPRLDAFLRGAQKWNRVLHQRLGAHAASTD